MARHIASRSGIRRHHAATAGAGKVAGWRLRAAALLLLSLTIGDGYAEGEAYRLQTIASDLRWPWGMARLPDGGFLVTEREGSIVLLHRDGRRSAVSGGPATLFAGQGGYFDIALDNAFASNRLVYLSYAEGLEQANGTAVYRAKLADGRLVDGERILRVSPDKATPQHYGGRLLMLDNDLLLVTTGEGFEHRETAQDRYSELGKVLRIDTSGNPAGVLNPGGEGRLRVWTLGHRNPQGLAYDAQDGVVYLHEHGPRGGDEVNQLIPGANYGWPVVTSGVDYSGAHVSPFRTAQGFVDPLWTWVPSIAPSGMAYYNGAAFPSWRGSLLVSALAGRSVRRLQLVERNIVDEEVLFAELGERIRDVRVFDDELFLLTDSERGSLIQVVPL